MPRPKAPLAPHGTPKRYRQHRDAGETPCVPCKAAHSRENRIAYAKRNGKAAPGQPMVVAEAQHGTRSGFNLHVRRGEVPVRQYCVPCADANAAKGKKGKGT